MPTRRQILYAGAAAAAAGWVRLADAQPAATLSVLHQNDLHSRHDPDSRGVGGSARITTLIARERAAAAADGRALVTLDAGDQFMGSLYYTHWRGAAERDVMAAIGFDAMALGNHEFDNGPPVLARFIRGLGAPILSANTDAEADPDLAGLIRPALVLQRGGLRIGIVGLTLPETPVISSPGPHVRFGAPAPALAEAVARLRREGVRTIIALTHLGLSADRALVAASHGIDLVVGGHSHTLLANGLSGAAGPTPVVVPDAEGRQVPIVQVGAYGRCIGRVDLALDADGRAVAFRAEALEAGADLAPDPTMVAVLARLEAPIAALRARVIGQATEAFPTAGCRRSECALGNAVADSLLAEARRYGAVAAITNAGGLRAPINPGPVTLGDVNAVLPFGNTLTVLTLRGADLRAALEHGFSLGPEGTGSGRFPQVAGLVVRFDPRRPPGQRITHLALRAPDGAEAPVLPDAPYRIATNSFLAGGGDAYAVLRDRGQEVYEASRPMDEILAEAIGRAGAVTPRLDGRLVRAE